MKPQDIQVNVTYKNKGAGRTHRTVLQISKDIPAPWYSSGDRPDEPVVEFSTSKGVVERLYLRSFAAWAGGVVSSGT